MPPLHTRFALSRIALLAALWAIPACSTPAGAPQGGDDSRTPSPTSPAILTVDAVRGHPVAIPLSPTAARPAEIPTSAEPATVVLASPPTAWIPPEPNAWLMSRPLPTVIPAPDAEPDAQGVLFAIAKVDQDAATLDLAGSTIAIRWFDEAPPPPRGPAPPDALASVLAPALADPTERWRAELLLARLGYSAPRARFTHDLFAQAHALNRAKWAAALARLSAADERTAQALTVALTRLVFDEPERTIPAWSTGDDAALLDDLLRQSASPESLVSTARAYVASLPRASAWILSDAGSSRAIEIAAASMQDAPQLLTVMGPSREPLELHPIAPGELQRITASPTTRTDSIRVEIGDWGVSLPTLARPIPAAPPGVRMGPFIRTLTRESWLSGSPALPDTAYATAALLQRRPGRAAWELYVECHRPPDAPNAPDFVRIWIGERDNPAAALRIDAEGFIIDDARPNATAQPITISRSDDAWTALVELPAAATANASPLLIGLERTDSRGVRTTWPRAVFPWDESPPRAPIDTRAWSPLESNDP